MFLSLVQLWFVLTLSTQQPLKYFNNLVINYPSSVYGLGCVYDNNITSDIWCFGGQKENSKSVFSFNGNIFSPERFCPPKKITKGELSATVITYYKRK